MLVPIILASGTSGKSQVDARRLTPPDPRDAGPAERPAPSRHPACQLLEKRFNL
ncbi:hypothetical protein SRB521_01071 [Intestinimonas butyriciproducens]|nr:hypothetical protein SRB521_01071 [Intestinimonas butyriciproducens]